MYSKEELIIQLHWNKEVPTLHLSFKKERSHLQYCDLGVGKHGDMLQLDWAEAERMPPEDVRVEQNWLVVNSSLATQDIMAQRAAAYHWNGGACLVLQLIRVGLLLEWSKALEAIFSEGLKMLGSKKYSSESKLENPSGGCICNRLGMGGEGCYLFLHSGCGECPILSMS